jgi:hypothetical protein
MNDESEAKLLRKFECMKGHLDDALRLRVEEHSNFRCTKMLEALMEDYHEVMDLLEKETDSLRM